MNSRERLLKTLKKEKPDRVPVSLYEFDGFYDSWIRDYPGYAEILEYAEDKTDKMYFWYPEQKSPALYYGEIDSSDIRSETREEKGSVHERTVVRTPKGELSSCVRYDEGVHTGWQIEHLCKNTEDAEKLLSIPYVPYEPDVSSFAERDKELGEKGILMGDIPDALCMTVELFGFNDFLMIYMDSPDIIFRLLDFFQERVYTYLNYLLENGAVTVYRIVGPEYATPPYMNPDAFDSLVTVFDTELVSLLHRYGGWARLHSHGKIKEVLPSFLEMGIDATDPVEPPPQGDITLKEARKVCGNDVVLIGNIEERLFEAEDKQDVEMAVKQAMEEGPAENGVFILCPSAMPLSTPLDRRVKENIMHYIDCGLAYGA